MKALSSTVFVHVSDLDRAINYYTTILGFSEDFRLADYAGLILDNIAIQLCGPGNQGMKKAVGSAHFCVDCDEVDECDLIFKHAWCLDRDYRSTRHRAAANFRGMLNPHHYAVCHSSTVSTSA